LRLALNRGAAHFPKLGVSPTSQSVASAPTFGLAQR
jgi:hypothetical protein